MPRPLHSALWCLSVAVVGTRAVVAAQLQGHALVWVAIALAAIAAAFVTTLLTHVKHRAESAGGPLGDEAPE